jgi:hypothetical protein
MGSCLFCLQSHLPVFLYAFGSNEVQVMGVWFCSLYLSGLQSRTNLQFWKTLRTMGTLLDHQYGFWHNRSTTDQIFYICHILEKKWEYNGTRKPMIQLGGKHYTIFSLSLEYPGNWWGLLKCA